MKVKTVVTLSGGADSAAAVLQFREDMAKKGNKVEWYGIFIDYGHNVSSNEFMRAKKFANKNKFKELKWVKLEGLFEGSSALHDQSDLEASVEAVDSVTTLENGTKIGSIYTPLRNMVILCLAGSYADMVKADYIITGSKGLTKTDGAFSYRDSTVPMMKLYESLLNYTLEDQRTVRVVAPLAEGRDNKMKKSEVFQLLHNHGYARDDTWSCFVKSREDKECGKCHNCREKELIYQQIERNK